MFAEPARWWPLKIEETGTRSIALSDDSPAINAAVITKLGLTYPLLSDTGSEIIDAYGVLNKEAEGRAAGIPHPVVFILDQQGVIRVKLMRERPKSAEIVGGLNNLK